MFVMFFVEDKVDFFGEIVMICVDVIFVGEIDDFGDDFWWDMVI